MPSPQESIALVTGASRGIGLAIKTLFEAKGITVLAPTRAELDLQNPESIIAYVASLSMPVSILVNNAGINELADLAEVDTAMTERMLQVNLLSQLQLLQALTPAMKVNRYGRIVNMASIWCEFSKERRLLYSVTKAGVKGLTTAAAVELAPYNVLVNAVAPGFVGTEMTRQNNSPEQLVQLAAELPIRRLAEPNEIAEVVYFLASEQNTFITGQTLFVDGGFSCV
ncbi:MAG: SDR family NAD(P)-dependent oxidoreductase [Vampirovibrionales bacterium]|jgi:3-oxoacyl-[acyl-carrier protein] reductase